jgi:polysaccharide biosynthesis/export protein
MQFTRHTVAFPHTVLLLASFLAISMPAAAQTHRSNTANKPAPASDYKIGPGDLLTITVMDAPEYGGKFRVSDTGMIEVPTLTAPVKAEGKSPAELGTALHEAFIDAKQLRDPKVYVFIEEYRGNSVTVLGSVTKPGVYPLEKRSTVLDAISLAGGAVSGSGDTITVVRGPATAEATNTEAGTVQFVQLSHLMDGRATNIEVRNGDVVSISAGQVVYVLGHVMKPGGFSMANPGGGVSVLQAVSLAQGFDSVAATNRGLLIRNSTSSRRIEIPVDLRNMQTGKVADVLMGPDDILYVPDSRLKESFKFMGDAAMAVINGVAIYGIGYRVGSVK